MTPLVHLSPVPLGTAGTTPWDFSPLWFCLLALALPAVLWVGLAWKRALEEDPNHLRRAGNRELHRLLSRLRRASGAPRPVDLHAWFQAAARTWGVRVSAPTGGEVTHSLTALDGDSVTRARWQELWKSTERGLYAEGGTLSPSWVQDVTAAANEVRIPPRKHWLPGRARHWLPSFGAAALCACAILAGRGDVLRAAERSASSVQVVNATPAQDTKPMLALDAKSAAALSAAQGPAVKALHSDWNNWAAHYNIAAEQMVQGNVDYAVAHLTAAFLQEPASGAVQDNLRWSLQQTGSMDPTLRRLLYGAWFQRYPALLSPASWQWLGLVAGLVVGAGLCTWVLLLYTTRSQQELRLAGRWAVPVGIALLALAVVSWNAWGELHRPNAAMTVEGINISPAPTDLVADKETLPVAAGSLTVTRASFLGWKQVRIVGIPGKVTGWIRAPYVMPLYAGR
jgi:hypothetical protein